MVQAQLDEHLARAQAAGGAAALPAQPAVGTIVVLARRLAQDPVQVRI